MSATNSDPVLIQNLQPLKDLISKHREEISILKKEVDMNPVASERHAKVAELQSKILKMDKLFDSNGQPKDLGLVQKLNLVLDFQ